MKFSIKKEIILWKKRDISIRIETDRECDTMKTRVKRFQNYRTQIQSMDEGDLPIAKSMGKYRFPSPEENHVEIVKPLSIEEIMDSHLSHEKKEEKTKKLIWNQNYIFIFVLLGIILFSVVLGIILLYGGK